jgi:hypothetical protein
MEVPRRAFLFKWIYGARRCRILVFFLLPGTAVSRPDQRAHIHQDAIRSSKNLACSWICITFSSLLTQRGEYKKSEGFVVKAQFVPEQLNKQTWSRGSLICSILTSVRSNRWVTFKQFNVISQTAADSFFSNVIYTRHMMVRCNANINSHPFLFFSFAEKWRRV